MTTQTITVTDGRPPWCPGAGGDEESRGADAYFKARQLDLFDSSAGWEDASWEDDF